MEGSSTQPVPSRSPGNYRKHGIDEIKSVGTNVYLAIFSPNSDGWNGTD